MTPIPLAIQAAEERIFPRLARIQEVLTRFVQRSRGKSRPAPPRAALPPSPRVRSVRQRRGLQEVVLRGGEVPLPSNAMYASPRNGSGASSKRSDERSVQSVSDCRLAGAQRRGGD